MVRANLAATIEFRRGLLLLVADQIAVSMGRPAFLWEALHVACVSLCERGIVLEVVDPPQSGFLAEPVLPTSGEESQHRRWAG